MATAVGIDGCRKGWFYFRKDGAVISHGISTSLVALIETLPAESRVSIDIPIGLPDGEPPTRACDTAARKLLGRHRASSVFPAPSRASLYAASYDAAKTLNQAATGRKLTRQTYAILPKIREADELMQGCSIARAMLRETHPELCFWAMNDGQAMLHSKKSDLGFEERLHLLENPLPQARSLVTHALGTYLRKDVARDDIADALACLVVASSLDDHLRSVPEEPVTDGKGIRMEILYALPSVQAL